MLRSGCSSECNYALCIYLFILLWKALSLSSHHPIHVFPRLSLSLFLLPLFILLVVQQAPEPRGKSCSQGNGNSPQSWYQNSLKCELSDSSQWAQGRAKHFQIPLPAECKQSRGLGESKWTCCVLVTQQSSDQSGWISWPGPRFPKLFFFFFGAKFKVLCCFCSESQGCAGGDFWWGNILSELEYWDEADTSRVISPCSKINNSEEKDVFSF